MGKLWVEVCLISARGLRRTSSLFKLQWYAVGWIDPNNKYCSRIDACGNANPVWKTKFSALVDISEKNLEDLVLHVEVYSREPVFLRESLQGTTTVVLREFLDKYYKDSEMSKPVVEEVGSFQLRKKTSNKPQGFVDVSIRISEEREDLGAHTGKDGFKLTEHNIIINSTHPYGSSSSSQPYPPQFSPAQIHRPPEDCQRMNPPYRVPFPSTHSNSAVTGPTYPAAGSRPTSYLNPSVVRPSYPPAGGLGYPPARTPPPPPLPPSNVGYMPTFLPRGEYPQSSYINMPPSASQGRGGDGGAGGFGIGMGAGALAAGAVLFGDDFMAGFDALGGGLQDPSLTIVADPPF